GSAGRIREMTHSKWMGGGAVLIALICSLFVTPIATHAQPAGKVYRVGFLTPQLVTSAPDAFKQKLRDLGYVEGQNLMIEFRSTEGKYERSPALARELVRLKVDLIVAPGGVSDALALKAATKTIPVVFFAGDAVESGLVQSLARPGGNLTGMS